MLKSILTNLKIPGGRSLLVAFSNIKKAYLGILKFLAQFFAHRFSQILKKHAYESQNTSFHTNNDFKGNNSHKNHHILTVRIKNHYTNNSHKNHYDFFGNH